VAGGLVVAGPELALRFELDRPGIDWAAAGGDAAAIVALPVAMRLGRTLRVEAPVDGRLLGGLRRMAEIWAAWRPDLFRPVAVEAPETKAEANAETGPQTGPETSPETGLQAGSETGPAAGAAGPALLAYSGGVDSTHALRELAQQGTRPDLLTVLGMDYRLGDRGRFARLIERSRPLCEALAGRHLVVASDAATVMRRFDVESYLGFGFQVFACLHLFAASHARGLIAADYPPWQELLVGPRGTFSGTNALFSSSRFAIGTLGLTATRGEKVAALARDPLALAALSFCKDYAARPDNCGVCSKCLRTKAMFVAATGEVPPIFRDPAFDLAAMPGLDLGRPYERVFAQDILRLARAGGREALVAPLVAGLAAPQGPRSWRHRLYKLRMLLRTRLQG
jgi:hypothetical protein